MFHVLVVDDHVPLAQSVAASVRHVGGTARVALTGAQALVQLLAERFQLMVIDQHMPGTCGLDVLREMRKPAYANAAHPMPQVVMLTADPDCEAAARATGVTDFISKANPLALLPVLERFAASLIKPAYRTRP